MWGSASSKNKRMVVVAAWRQDRALDEFAPSCTFVTHNTQIDGNIKELFRVKSREDLISSEVEQLQTEPLLSHLTILWRLSVAGQRDSKAIRSGLVQVLGNTTAWPFWSIL
jgi:hypothetical protein